MNNLVQLTELTGKYDQAQEILQQQQLELENGQLDTRKLYLKINCLETQLNMEKYEAR